MKKVPTYLLDMLLAASEGQKVEPFATTVTVQNKIDDFSYQKGHNVPEGSYTVKLLYIKCHNKTTYYMKVQVLNKAGSNEPYDSLPTISGYGRRYGSDFSDLAECFGNGTPLNSSKAYVGSYGDIYLTHSGWIKLQPQNRFLPKTDNDAEVVFGD